MPALNGGVAMTSRAFRRDIDLQGSRDMGTDIDEITLFAQPAILPFNGKLRIERTRFRSIAQRVQDLGKSFFLPDVKLHQRVGTSDGAQGGVPIQ